MTSVRLTDPFETRPFDGPIDAVAAIPGSKSFTNRALVAAALAGGTSELLGVLDSDDTQAMVACLSSIGLSIVHERATATMLVEGTGGHLPTSSARIDVRQSGVTARFLVPLLALGHGHFVIDGHPQMRARPMRDLLDALLGLGVDVRSVSGDGRLPLTLDAHGVEGQQTTVAGDVSSQFLSGLLLASPCFERGITIDVEGELVSKPYVDMTLATMASFGAKVDRDQYARFVIQPTGYRAATYRIEPDASAASYAFAAAAITGGRVRVTGLGHDARQGDVAFVDALARMGCAVERLDDAIEVRGPQTLHAIDIDMSDFSDTAQTLAVVAAFARGVTRVRGVGFIRRKETDRVGAVVEELQRCGIQAEEHEDGFDVHGGPAHAATIETYEDHRMAMSFALFGLCVPGIRIANPRCVSKTFPEYFTMLEGLRP